MQKEHATSHDLPGPFLTASWKRQSDGIGGTKLILDTKILSAPDACESGTDGSFAMFATDMQVAVGAGERMLGHSGRSLWVRVVGSHGDGSQSATLAFCVFFCFRANGDQKDHGCIKEQDQAGL